MPANVKSLIEKLKRAYPELSDEPMMDELLDASYSSDDASSESEDGGDELDMPMDEGADSEAEPDMASEDDDMDMLPMDMPKLKSKRKPLA